MSVAEGTRAEPQELLENTPKQLLIDGRWVDAVAGETIGTMNPATGEVLAAVAEAREEDVDRAVAAARRAFEGSSWRLAKPVERQRILLRLADLLEKHAEEFSVLETLDMGAPLSRTRVVTRRALERLYWYAGLATGIAGETIENSLPGNVLTYTTKEPVGVVGAIIPWNGPTGTIPWKVGPVLASGCTMVLKAPEDAPLTALRFGQLCLDAGVPEGVVNVVTGYGETAGAALSGHLDVDKVSFTGSVQTGQKIVAASVGNLKRLSLELGGKSPNVVFADADLDEAVPQVAMAVFGNAGQMCTAGSRLFVEKPIYEEFVERVARFGEGLRVGSGLDPRTDVGPLISRRQLDRVATYLEIGRTEGARLASGGVPLVGKEHAKGFFVAPTVFADVRDGMRIAAEEIFGPVISTMSFEDIEDVAQRANASPYGLAAGLWTRDLNKAHRLSRLIRAGTVWINSYNLMDPALPFGGYRLSGYGRESGLHHLDEYVEVKSVFIQVQ